MSLEAPNSLSASTNNAPSSSSGAAAAASASASPTSSADQKAMLVNAIERSLKQIQQNAVALANRKKEAKSFLAFVEDLLKDDDEEEDETVENENDDSGGAAADNNDAPTASSSSEPTAHPADVEKAEEPKKKKKIAIQQKPDPITKFCAKVADFVHTVHLDIKMCSPPVASLYNSSVTETVKVRKICRDIMQHLVSLCCIYFTPPLNSSPTSSLLLTVDAAAGLCLF